MYNNEELNRAILEVLKMWRGTPAELGETLAVATRQGQDSCVAVGIATGMILGCKGGQQLLEIERNTIAMMAGYASQAGGNMRKQHTKKCEVCGHKQRNIKKCHVCKKTLSNNVLESYFVWCSTCGYVLCGECEKLEWNGDIVLFGPHCERCIEPFSGDANYSYIL